MAVNHEESSALTFTKAQIVASKKFRQHRDLLAGVLEDKQYTEQEINKLINTYMKGKVNEWH